MHSRFSHLAAALFGKKSPEQREPPEPEPPLIRFWEEPEAPYHITLTDVQALERRFRHVIDRSLLIGLSSDMDIPVSYDRSVSRRHCELVREGDLFYLINHSRSNGTLLNHRLVTEKTPVRDGDVITMGRVELRLEIDG